MTSVILTGASGFLGNYIHQELAKTHEVITISRVNADINTNLAFQIPQLPQADIVVHCAGKAHSVPKTEMEKQTFFDVNVTGTANLLKGIETNGLLPIAFVFVSTVAVYGCDSGVMINEQHPLNATDPYGQSKIQAEHLVESWCFKNGVICAILRLPLLVGNNAPGNLGSMINGIKKGFYFNIAGGKAKKSMVMALDVAKLIPIVTKIGGVYNLTDGYHPSFDELSKNIAEQFHRKKPLNMPLWLAKILASVGNLLGNKVPINTSKLNKITSDLTFDDFKARKELNWSPSSVIKSFKAN